MNREYSLSVSTADETVFSSGIFSSVEYVKAIAGTLNEQLRIFEDAKELNRLSKKYGVKVRSFHLPFAEPFKPASLDKEERKWALETTKQLIEYMLPCGIEYVILHGGVNVNPEKTQEQLDVFIKYIQELCDFCLPYKITVAVETLKPVRIGNGVKEHLYIMNKVNRTNVGICFDCNHFIGEDPIDFLKEAGRYVVTTHLSDYDAIDEKHWYPGRGVIDWKLLVKSLDDCGYNGPFVFEVNWPGKTPLLSDLKQLIYEWEQNFNE